MFTHEKSKGRLVGIFTIPVRFSAVSPHCRRNAPVSLSPGPKRTAFSPRRSNLAAVPCMRHLLFRFALSAESESLAHRNRHIPVAVVRHGEIRREKSALRLLPRASEILRNYFPRISVEVVHSRTLIELRKRNGKSRSGRYLFRILHGSSLTLSRRCDIIINADAPPVRIRSDNASAMTALTIL